MGSSVPSPQFTVDSEAPGQLPMAQVPFPSWPSTFLLRMWSCCREVWEIIISPCPSELHSPFLNWQLLPQAVELGVFKESLYVWSVVGCGQPMNGLLLRRSLFWIRCSCVEIGLRKHPVNLEKKASFKESCKKEKKKVYKGNQGECALTFVLLYVNSKCKYWLQDS